MTPRRNKFMGVPATLWDAEWMTASNRLQKCGITVFLVWLS